MQYWIRNVTLRPHQVNYFEIYVFFIYFRHYILSASAFEEFLLTFLHMHFFDYNYWTP